MAVKTTSVEAVYLIPLNQPLGVGLDHDVAVDEDRADDRAGEQGVGEHVDGDPSDGMEG